MAWPPADGKPYMPSNGTEGADFEANWCRHCQNRDGAGDWEDEFGNEVEGSCIIAEAMFWSPEFQPAELKIRNGRPHCTAFREDPDNPARCLMTKEMDL